MTIMLGQIMVGKVDGKHEYLSPINERNNLIYDAFVIPDAIDERRINNGDIHFIEGFRGTGKTSLLRWHAKKIRESGYITDFTLFKSDLTETQRLGLSKEVGISWADIDASTMEISQDFKDAWTWFTLHRIGEILNADSSKPSKGELHTLSKLLGLNSDSALKKVLGFLPKIDGASIKLKGDVSFFEFEMGGDFKSNKEGGEITLNALNQRVLKVLKNFSLSKPIYIYFDELEAFYHTEEQHKRDLRMVRDLLFVVAKLNEFFNANALEIHIAAAVRSEVVDAMGALGQEIDRLVHDKGFLISWHHAKRSAEHPLMEIIARKIQASERHLGLPVSENPLEKYFPKIVRGNSIEAFFLDSSFYKPRDIVWRLSLAQKIFPKETKFSETVLHETESEYSAKMWDEVRYELSATYSEKEIDGIELALSGNKSTFLLDEVESWFADAGKLNKPLQELLRRRAVSEIMSDLYRLGAIGNFFRVGKSASDVKHRWVFRGDPTLLPDKKMTVNFSLLKRLSAIAERRRGSKGRRESGKGQITTL